jgi:hypothetical protein
MTLKENIQKYWVLILGVFLLILLSILFWQRENIAEHKVTKAKIEIFKAAQNKDKERIKEVLDSLGIK